eukprot:434431_1
MSSFYQLFLIIFLIWIHVSKSQQTITLSAISELSSSVGKSIAGAQWLAIQEINNSTDLIPKIHLEFEIYDSKGDGGEALVKALNITDVERRQNKTHFPISLGCPWSSLSTITSPVLAAFNMGQISSSSTSVLLSDTSKYPYFYRTIPSDSLQAQGIILLCQEFNWTKIAVVYDNDQYGSYLSINIVELALEVDIQATAVAFSRDKSSTLTSAASQVKQLNAFIIVFIVSDTVLDIAFDEFRKQGLTGYPYYYVAVDSWIDTDNGQHKNVMKYVEGSIGTVPWQPLALPLQSYHDDIKPIINDSMIIYDRFLSLWSYYYNIGYSDELKIDIPARNAIYAYDAVYTLAYVLQQYINDGMNIETSNDINITKLNEIILNDIHFIGATGTVEFNNFGDRLNGLYAFANVLQNGQVEYFGYFYQQLNESKLWIDHDKIMWPSDFEKRGIIPQSDIIIIDEIVAINTNILIPIYVLSILSICITITYVLLTWKYHLEKAIRSASWKINLVMCFGCLCGYVTMIIYGIDESSISAGPLFSFLCNFRLWLWIMSYTLLFMPLFAKTYRLSRIFTGILEKK